MSIVVAAFSLIWIPVVTILGVPIAIHLARREAGEYYQGIDCCHISEDRYDSCW